MFLEDRPASQHACALLMVSPAKVSVEALLSPPQGLNSGVGASVEQASSFFFPPISVAPTELYNGTPHWKNPLAGP